MSLNANALTTISRVKALPGMSGISDSKAEEAINFASNEIEKYLGRKLGYSSSITESLQGSGDRRLYLSRFPIRSVISVTKNDEEIDLSELSEITGTENSNEEGWIYRKNGWPIEVEDRNPLGEPELLTEAYPFTIEYSAGYRLPNESLSSIEALPFEIQLACESISLEYLMSISSAESIINSYPKVSSERTAGGYSVTYDRSSTKAEESTITSKARIYLSEFPKRKSYIL
jgi:hypothetical protein